jgi:hypothetical protein
VTRDTLLGGVLVRPAFCTVRDITNLSRLVLGSSSRCHRDKIIRCKTIAGRSRPLAGSFATHVIATPDDRGSGDAGQRIAQRVAPRRCRAPAGGPRWLSPALPLERPVSGSAPTSVSDPKPTLSEGLVGQQPRSNRPLAGSQAVLVGSQAVRQTRSYPPAHQLGPRPDRPATMSGPQRPWQSR